MNNIAIDFLILFGCLFNCNWRVNVCQWCGGVPVCTLNDLKINLEKYVFARSGIFFLFLPLKQKICWLVIQFSQSLSKPHTTGLSHWSCHIYFFFFSSHSIHNASTMHPQSSRGHYGYAATNFICEIILFIFKRTISRALSLFLLFLLFFFFLCHLAVWKFDSTLLWHTVKSHIS